MTEAALGVDFTCRGFTGAGAAQALGAHLLDDAGREVGRGGGGLDRPREKPCGSLRSRR